MTHTDRVIRDQSRGKKSLFVALWLLCILGSWAVLPYGAYLGIAPSSVSFVKVFTLITCQSVIVFGIVCWLSYLLVPKTDLSPFSIQKGFRSIIYPGVSLGVVVGLVIYLLNTTVFGSSLLSEAHPPVWTGLLASLYGGINEEVLLRLFFFTLLYFSIRSVFRTMEKGRLFFLWVVNVIVAIVFGIGHLPAALKLVTPSSLEISRVLLLNGIPGVVFGWLYWSRGLWAAMTAHLTTDLMIHVFLV